jgi:hypothetical protein
MSNAASAMPGRSAPGTAYAPRFRQVRDFSDAISTGFRYIREHWRSLYRPLLFICLPVKVVASVLLGSFFHDFRPGRFPATGSFTSMFGGYALIILAYLLGSVVICEYMRWTLQRPGQRPSLGEVWRESRRHVLFYLALSLVTGIIAVMGFFLFLLPFFFLITVFQFSYPLHAFERADFGECIGRAFSIVWGRWWMTFAMLVVLVTMSVLLNMTVDVPAWLLTTFGTISGFQEGTSDVGVRLQWFITLFSLFGNLTALLLLPFVQVPMCFHMLSTLEKKEAPGLLVEVQAFTLDPKA